MQNKHREMSLREISAHPAFQAGFYHALAGEAYHPMYERANIEEQTIYESGRHFGCCWKLKGPPGNPYDSIEHLTFQALMFLDMLVKAGDVG